MAHTFAALSHGPTATSWVHVGTPREPDIHRFETTTDGWYGNVELFVLSQYHWEQRVNAWVDGGREDMFLLPADDKARVFDGTNNWAQVFGPIGYDPSVREPSAAGLLATGVAFLTLWLRTKR